MPHCTALPLHTGRASRWWSATLLAVVVLAVLPSRAAAQAAAAPDGGALYVRLCANCHENGLGRAPTRDAFRSISAASCSVAFRSVNPFTRWMVPESSRTL